MPVEIIGGHPCKYCNCWSKEAETDFQYYWVDIGLILVERTSRYVYETCKVTSIQVIEHWEETREQGITGKEKTMSIA